MRRLHRLLLPLVLAGTLAAPALASESLLGERVKPPSSDRAVRAALPEDRTGRLEEDFTALAEAKTAREARGPERRILSRLSTSDSDTVNLLMDWSARAMNEREFTLALDLVDQAIALDPSFAEAYNRRATIHFATDDYRRSLADIETTLALEPRHFGALSGLAAILGEIGETERAIEIYHRVLEIHPTMEAAKTALEGLREEAEGSPI